MTPVTLKNISSQLEQGIKIEAEHSGTWDRIKAGEITSPDQLYQSIAQDHVKEHADYYDKLKSAGL
jgi:hypothetical protein